MTAPESTSPRKRIVGLFPELLGVGGIQEAGRLTTKALSEIASRHVWSTDFLSLNDPPGSHLLEGDGRSITIRGFGRAKISFVISAIGRVRSATKDGTPIVLAGHPNLAVPADWMRRTSPRAKTIVMAHGMEVWKPLPSFRRRALLRADLVLAPSRDTVQKLIDVQGLAPEKIRRLAWPLSATFLRMADAPAGLPLPPAFPQAGLVILTVGRWVSSERYKGADELIRAIAQLQIAVPSLQLVAVGGGDDLSRLRELAIGLGVADRVHFLENLSREEVAACYARADLFALPSTGEGFGLVYLEAMAFSRAVVGVACGGTTDIVEDGVNGLLVPPHGADALAHTLGRLLGDEPLRTQLGKRGAEIVRRKYDFGAFRTELERILFDSILREQAMA
jgi:glycosyltransferase involved in cell wall biosynthesis